jgi:hypothetical protein
MKVRILSILGNNSHESNDTVVFFNTNEDLNLDEVACKISKGYKLHSSNSKNKNKSHEMSILFNQNRVKQNTFNREIFRLIEAKNNQELICTK